MYILSRVAIYIYINSPNRYHNRENSDLILSLD